MREDLENLKQSGRLNSYLFDLIVNKYERLSPELQKKLLDDATNMSMIGVKSDEDYKIFFYIIRHLKSIANDLAGKTLDPEILSELAAIVFSNKDHYPIDTIFNFYKATANALSECNIPISKKAYPQGYDTIEQRPAYNVQKWIQTMRELYAAVHQGMNISDAFNFVTKDWDVMEKQNFKHWTSFYQEDAQQKYKTAQYLEDNNGAPLVPLSDLKAIPKKMIMPNIDQNYIDDKINRINEQKAQKEQARQEAKDKIKYTKSKLVSRLNAAIKLSMTPEIQELLGGEVSSFVKGLQDLVREINLTKLQSLDSPILNDLIIRKSNMLLAEGFYKAAKCVRAQVQPVAKEQIVEPEEELEEEETEHSAVSEFISNMNNPIEYDDKDIEDVLDSLASITVTSQAINPMERPITKDIPVETVTEPAEIEITEPPVIPEAIEEIKSDEPNEKELDLTNVTVEDIVAKLELVSNILKNREIPRQLSMIDLMLDQLGMAAYFPTLGEATRSALESNQYMSTRIEDILSKLRGSIVSEEEIELTTTDIETPQKELHEIPIEKVKENLTEIRDKEEQQQEVRKKRREAIDLGEPVEKTPVPEELTAPVEVERVAPARVETPPTPRPAPIR